MSPRKSLKKLPKKDATLQNDKESVKFYNVEKELFRIQFEAKEKIIIRLNDVCKVLEKNISKCQRKTIEYDTKLKEEYEYAKKVLEEKNILLNKLNAEIESLQQEADTMVQRGKNKLKEKDDEFMREVGLIKSGIAVYVARQNMLGEFIKQEKMLQQKCVEKKEKIAVMNEAYETELKKIEEKVFRGKETIQREMLTRCVDFAIHLKKQTLKDSDPGTSTKDLHDLKDMLNIVKEQNRSLEVKTLAMKEDTKRFISLKRENQKSIDRLYDVYLEKKRTPNGRRTDRGDSVTDGGHVDREPSGGGGGHVDREPSSGGGVRAVREPSATSIIEPADVSQRLQPSADPGDSDSSLDRLFGDYVGRMDGVLSKACAALSDDGEE